MNTYLSQPFDSLHDQLLRFVVSAKPPPGTKNVFKAIRQWFLSGEDGVNEGGFGRCQRAPGPML